MCEFPHYGVLKGLSYERQSDSVYHIIIHLQPRKTPVITGWLFWLLLSLGKCPLMHLEHLLNTWWYPRVRISTSINQWTIESKYWNPQWNPQWNWNTINKMKFEWRNLSKIWCLPFRNYRSFKQSTTVFTNFHCLNPLRQSKQMM